MNSGISGWFQNIRSAESKTISLAKAVLIVIMLILLLIWSVRFFWVIYYDFDREIDQSLEVNMTRYNSLVRLIADAERYQEESRVLASFKMNYLEPGMIQAATPALAEAQFQDLINSLAQDSSLTVQSMRVLPRTQEDGITSLNMGINARGEIQSIKEFLFGVEYHDKFIFVDQLEVRIINQRERRFFNFNIQVTAWTKL